MAKKTNAGTSYFEFGQRRTREHVIEGLSVNHVERLALKAGFVVQSLHPDYGVDLRLLTFDEHGVVEGEHVSLQLKATDRLERYLLQGKEVLSFPVETSHYYVWARQSLLPVFLIVYDAVLNEAYWLHIQAYDRERQPELDGKTLSVHIPCHHVLGVQSMHMMRQRKQDVFTENRNLLNDS